MASISKGPKGTRTIQFVGVDKRRRSIRLGKVSQRVAEGVKLHVEELVKAALTGTAPSDDTSRWVARLDDWMRDRLANVGLVPKRAKATLKAFLDAFIASRGDVKPSTKFVYNNTRRNLIDAFGADRPMRDITPGDADEWRLGLLKELAPATVARRVKCARQFFKAAQRKRLIIDNPFADVKAGSEANPDRYRFITRDETAKLLKACPNLDWRLIVALARYGGLRTPSETLSLRWSDVDWENGRLTIPSPKTEHHQGGESRVIPLFPELRKILQEALGATLLEDAVGTGRPASEFVITRYRDPSKNLRTHMLRIIGKAGLTAWEKPFQNMRSSRETELTEKYPLHVVCAWIGNSEPVARKHYLQVTDEHFALAIQGQDGALQKAVQQPAANAPEEASQPVTSDASVPAVLCGNHSVSEGSADPDQYARQDSNLRPED